MAAETWERHQKLTAAELTKLHHDVGVRLSHELKRDSAGHFMPRDVSAA